MHADFTPTPHKEAVALIAGKTAVTKKVFNALLPELRGRAFTVAGIASMDALQRIRDAVASVPQGAAGGQTWDEAKKQIVDELDPYLGDGADYRATLILRTNGFQAFSLSIYDAAQADDDTTHLQYLHGECKVPTPSHLALNGIVLPKNDEFWQTHTGPWGHLGCVCYVRPMNPDLVDDEREKDKKRNPDDRNVIEGPALKQLHHGDVLRGGRHYDVNIDGPDNSGFHWAPGDLKIPLKELEKKYDPEVWNEFQNWAQQEKLSDNQSVWDWLISTDRPALPKPSGAPEPETPAAPVPTNAFAEVLKKFKAAKMSQPVMDKVASLPPAVAPLLANLEVEATRGRAHYTRAKKTIALSKDPKNWNGTTETAVHEIGHHLHYETGTITSLAVDPQFKAAAAVDMKRFESWAETKLGSNWRSALANKNTVAGSKALAEALGYVPGKPLSLSEQFRIARWADTIMGISGGRYGFGHKPVYMRDNGLKEVFTHTWTALVDSDEEFVKLFSGVSDEVRRALKI